MQEERRYRSDDLDIEDNELVISQGGNGDWYISIVKTGERIGPHVRLTTSGARRQHAAVASIVASLYRALVGDVELERELEATMSRAGWCALGVGDGTGKKFVYGPYEVIAELRERLCK